MQAITKQFISMTILLVIVFLVLTHFTGFSRDIGALGSNYSHLVATFQGRG